MLIDFQLLVADFKQRATYDSVEFIDQNGEWATNSDPRFSTISDHLQPKDISRKTNLSKLAGGKHRAGGSIDTSKRTRQRRLKKRVRLRSPPILTKHELLHLPN